MAAIDTARLIAGFNGKTITAEDALLLAKSVGTIQDAKEARLVRDLLSNIKVGNVKAAPVAVELIGAQAKRGDEVEEMSGNLGARHFFEGVGTIIFGLAAWGAGASCRPKMALALLGAGLLVVGTSVANTVRTHRKMTVD